MLYNAASHDNHCQTGLYRRVQIFVFKRNWNIMGGSEVPLLKCQETLVLIRPTISVFWELSVAWRLWLLKFQISHAVSHSFLISADIHLTPEILVPKDLR